MVDFVLAAFACLAKCFVVKIALCLRTHSFIVCYFVCVTVPLAEPIASVAVAVAVESVPALSVSAPATQPTVEQQPASQLASMPPAVSLFAAPAGGLGGPGGGGPGGGGGGLSLMEMIRARRKD